MKSWTFVVIAASLLATTEALNIVLAGGTGEIGRLLAPKLREHDVTVLTRNAFLAASPARVTEQFGWLGKSFLDKNRHVKLRDWDGGDLLDIVGCDWMGWQDDALAKADLVIHLVGGYTEQRTMACERLVRESYRVNPKAWQVTVSPSEDDMGSVFPLVPASVKRQRVEACESMVEANCANTMCLRIEGYRVEESAQAIADAIAEKTKVAA